MLRDAALRSKLAPLVAPSAVLAHGGSAYASPARLLGEYCRVARTSPRTRERITSAGARARGSRIRFRPEIALTRLGLAELLIEHYPAEEAAAQEHLDFAIEEFREMKMQPSLERALRHKGLLKA